MGYQLPQNIRPILEPLAKAVFPLSAWLAKSKPALPELIPALASVPWRSASGAATLSLTELHAIDFFVQQFDDDGENERLMPRWKQLKITPQSFFPQQWRLDRGLYAGVRFAVFDAASSNVVYVVNASDGSKDPATRLEFYDACWGPLLAAYTATLPQLPADWTKFGDRLLRNDLITEWKPSGKVSSSDFLKRFTVDVLFACLGQRNPSIPGSQSLLQRAVLIEANENRHVGNQYTEAEVTKAVTHLKDELDNQTIG